MDTADLVKEINFDIKLKHINEKVDSNKTKYVLVQNEPDELLGKVELISRTELTKH